MKIVQIVTFALLLSCSPNPFALKFELHPYAGGAFGRTDADPGEIKDQGISGGKLGFALTERSLIGGNFGYLNHVGIRNRPEICGFLYEAM